MVKSNKEITLCSYQSKLWAKKKQSKIAHSQNIGQKLLYILMVLDQEVNSSVVKKDKK
jgi:hypothetical protein